MLLGRRDEHRFWLYPPLSVKPTTTILELEECFDGWHRCSPAASLGWSLKYIPQAKDSL